MNSGFLLKIVEIATVAVGLIVGQRCPTLPPNEVMTIAQKAGAVGIAVFKVIPSESMFILACSKTSHPLEILFSGTDFKMAFCDAKINCGIADQ